VLALAFAITTAKMYPTVKYALGFGKACQRITVAGSHVVVVREEAGAGAAPGRAVAGAAHAAAGVQA